MDPKVFGYNLGGTSGTFALAGQGSFDGFPSAVTGAGSVTINQAYSGSPPTNFPACATQPITYNVNIDPNPRLISVTAATGTVDWGDGSQSAITQPVMTFQKQYAASGTYSITLSAN